MQSGKPRILIVEDHTLLRAGLRALLAQDPDIEIAGETDNGRNAAQAAGALLPDLVLMDIFMPGMNGIGAIRDIKRISPKTHVLVLTIHKSNEYILESLRAGADGYILKDAMHDELRLAIHSTLNGKIYLSPDVSGHIINGYLHAGSSHGCSSGWDSLTHREREVLKLVAGGYPNKYIADYFSLSVKTVEKHRSNLMKKLDLHNAATLTAYAIKKGLIVS